MIFCNELKTIDQETKYAFQTRRVPFEDNNL